MMTDFLHNPLLSLFVTIASYVFAQWLQKKVSWGEYLSPPVVSIACVCAFILVADIQYEEYLKHTTLIHGFLGPVTVALAIPLYRQLQTIKRSIKPILVSVLVSCIVAAFVGYALADYMGAGEDIKRAIMPKSTTMPVAIGITEKIGGDAALAVFFVFTTGILGTLVATAIFQLARITDKVAIGFTLGVTCHALGVAKAMQYGEKATAFAVLGLSLMGIISGVLLPILITAFLF